MKNIDIKTRYRFVAQQWNNVLQDGKDFEIWGKYFMKGLDLLRPYNPEFAGKMEFLYKCYLEKKTKQIIILTTLALLFPQLTPLIKSKMFGVLGIGG